MPYVKDRDGNYRWFPSGGGSGTAGKDGITPHIGVNGNWYLAETDTGVPATGPQGPAGDDYTLTDADKSSIAALVKGLLPTETWTITYEDGTVVQKNVPLL